MRDIELLPRTLGIIHDDGAGIATQHTATPRGFIWHVGTIVLNPQAVADLIADGWLAFPNDATEARIDAWPSFAGSHSG